MEEVEATRRVEEGLEVTFGMGDALTRMNERMDGTNGYMD